MYISYVGSTEVEEDVFDHDLRLATNASGDWDLDTVDDERIPGHPSLALDAWGTVHIAYHHLNFTVVLYATNRIALDPDGVDQNCDGVDGLDIDGDGHASIRTGGDDCNDADPKVFEGCE